MSYWETHSDVETQQVADHGGHCRQDDHPSDVVDEWIDGQAEKAEWCVQLLAGG